MFPIALRSNPCFYPRPKGEINVRCGNDSHPHPDHARPARRGDGKSEIAPTEIAIGWSHHDAEVAREKIDKGRNRQRSSSPEHLHPALSRVACPHQRCQRPSCLHPRSSGSNQRSKMVACDPGFHRGGICSRSFSGDLHPLTGSTRFRNLFTGPKPSGLAPSRSPDLPSRSHIALCSAGRRKQPAHLPATAAPRSAFPHSQSQPASYLAR